MRSILNQLKKYIQPINEDGNKIVVVEPTHPYRKMLNELCGPDIDAERLEEALFCLCDFIEPPSAGKLYPLELAILYHLFYRHNLLICNESVADKILKQFLANMSRQDGGLNRYMKLLRDNLDNVSISIFLYRVMLAGLGERSPADLKTDHLPRHFAVKAAQSLGVEATAAKAAKGLDSFKKADVEQLILGRITYLAFWHWSQINKIDTVNQYLDLKQVKLLASI